mmetsp:Transcript_19968/g.25492  ORF Transcript_19968/g.25492 Transcript_19968/m.25492 type:complete len:262 (-) Transcript_19968:103-888(-)
MSDTGVLKHGESLAFNRDDERSVVYSMMLRHDRREIHREILFWFENKNSKSCDSHEAGLLGYHALLSEYYLKSFAYFEYSIKSSLETGNVSNALSLIQQCIELLENPEVETQMKTRGSLVMNRVKIYVYWGQCFILKRSWDEAFNVLEIAVEKAAESDYESSTNTRCLPKTFSGNTKMFGMLRNKSSRSLLTFDEIDSFINRSEPIADFVTDEQRMKFYAEETKRYVQAARSLIEKIRKLKIKYAKQLNSIDKMSSSIMYQ